MLIVEKYKYVTWKHVEKASVTQTYHRRESGGVGQFFVIVWKKKTILMPLNHNSQLVRAI